MTCHWSWRNNFAAFVKKKDHFSAPVAICKRKISNLQGKILQSVQLLISAFFFSVNFIQLASFIWLISQIFHSNLRLRGESSKSVWDIWLSFSLVSVANTIQSLGIVTLSPSAGLQLANQSRDWNHPDQWETQMGLNPNDLWRNRWYDRCRPDLECFYINEDINYHPATTVRRSADFYIFRIF